MLVGACSRFLTRPQYCCALHEVEHHPFSSSRPPCPQSLLAHVSVERTLKFASTECTLRRGPLASCRASVNLGRPAHLSAFLFCGPKYKICFTSGLETTETHRSFYLVDLLLAAVTRTGLLQGSVAGSTTSPVHPKLSPSQGLAIFVSNNTCMPYSLRLTSQELIAWAAMQPLPDCAAPAHKPETA